MDASFEPRVCSLPGLANYSLDQPSYKSRPPSASPLSPKQMSGPSRPALVQNGATGVENTVFAPRQATLPADGVPQGPLQPLPATIQPSANPNPVRWMLTEDAASHLSDSAPVTPPGQVDKAAMCMPSHPSRMMAQGEKLGSTLQSPSSNHHQSMLPPAAKPPCCSCMQMKQQAAYQHLPRTHGLRVPVMPPPAQPNMLPPLSFLGPYPRGPQHPHSHPHPQFGSMAPPYSPHGFGPPGFAPLMTPPMAASPNLQAKPKPTGLIPPSQQPSAAPPGTGAKYQHMQPAKISVFRPPASLIQPTYRKPSPNLIVDVAETCQEKFPFEEVARRHNTSVEKVVDVFAAIIKVPLLRCPTDRRRAGKLATARVKEYEQAKKSICELHGDIPPSHEDVARQMSPVDLPDGFTLPRE